MFAAVSAREMQGKLDVLDFSLVKDGRRVGGVSRYDTHGFEASVP
jgi:hypothetical protein